MEKHKVSWFSFGEWCTSFLSVKKMFRCIFKIVTSFSPDISHILALTQCFKITRNSLIIPQLHIRVRNELCLHRKYLN